MERDDRQPDELDLYQDPLDPFTPFETAISVVKWAVSLPHLALWLGVFNVLDKTFVPGTRFDRLGKFVCRRVTDLNRIRVKQHGLQQLDPEGSYIFCINHVSILDLFVVFQSIPYFHRSFQDIKHFKIPLYGGCIRVFGQIPVDRKNKELNMCAFERAVEMIGRGESFVVFPEGHRTRDGRLRPFYRGAFQLAIKAQVPIVPVGLKGLRNICPAEEWRVRSGTVDVLFGEPIPTEGCVPEDAENLARDARRALNELMRSAATE